MEPELYEYVQITVAEQVGVEHRGGYYDHAGALRDMIQNHLFQLLCLTAMEPPVSFNADEVRNKKVDVLKAIRKYKPEDSFLCVRGQYDKGWIEGQNVIGYREEPGVNPKSTIETFAAVKFLLITGDGRVFRFICVQENECLKEFSAITIQFEPVPHKAFPAETIENWQPNRLTINIQPQKGITLTIPG